jgi:hypothetical protein
MGAGDTTVLQSRCWILQHCDYETRKVTLSYDDRNQLYLCKYLER